LRYITVDQNRIDITAAQSPYIVCSGVFLRRNLLHLYIIALSGAVVGCHI
jgi:hypothetical protein